MREMIHESPKRSKNLTPGEKTIYYFLIPFLICTTVFSLVLIIKVNDRTSDIKHRLLMTNNLIDNLNDEADEDSSLSLESIEQLKTKMIELSMETCSERVKSKAIRPDSPLIELLKNVTYFDNLEQNLTGEKNINERTTIVYFPSINPLSGFQPRLNSNVIDSGRYKKFRSVPHTIGFFMNVSMADVLPTDPRLSIFIKNIEDRGDPSKPNYEKVRYMSALTKLKVVNRYADKIEKFISSFHDLITISKMAVHSTFQKELLTFFLDMHTGTDDHPQFVRDYFTDFMYFVSIADPNDTNRGKRLLNGHVNAICVAEYFRKRIAVIEKEKLTDTITYHWIKAGMPTETVVMEAIHNIVAFFQFQNTLDLLIRNSLNVTEPVGIIPTPERDSFFDLMVKAENEAAFNRTESEIQQLNVVREALRIMLPNDVWFSKDANHTNHVQVRHSPKLIMWNAENQNVTIGMMKWGRVNAFNNEHYTDFNGRFSTERPIDEESEDNENGVETGTIIDTESWIQKYLKEEFIVSPVDQKTIIPKADIAFIPVHSRAVFAPFGLGDRRCPGEVFSKFVLVKLLKKTKHLKFRVSPAFIHKTMVPLAPFKTGTDNIFVDFEP